MKRIFVSVFIMMLPVLAIMPASLMEGGEQKSKVQLEGKQKHAFVREEKKVQDRQLVSSNSEMAQKLDAMPIPESDPTKWAFIIAAEKYDETDTVAYSVKSGALFKEVAQKILKVSKRRTYTLLGEDATAGKIKNGMRKLLKFVRPGDTIYFYYSGHGIPDIATKDAYLLPKDMDPAYIGDEPKFKLATIYKTLEQSNAGKVIAFIDSCFSGATDNKSLFKGVAATRIKAKAIEVDKSKMVVLTAGQDKQFSNMYKEQEMRLFSYALIKNLIKGERSIEKVFLSVKDEVELKSFDMGDQYYQSPTIAGNTKMKF